MEYLFFWVFVFLGTNHPFQPFKAFKTNCYGSLHVLQHAASLNPASFLKIQSDEHGEGQICYWRLNPNAFCQDP